MSSDPASLEFCYLTTTGRITSRGHRIEIWFALSEGMVYLLAGDRDRADWIRNLMISPEVALELGERKRVTTARVVAEDSEQAALARRLLVEKYQPGHGDDLSEWGRTSLPVAIDWPEAPETS